MNRLTQEQRLEIGRRVVAGEKQIRLAEEFDISKQGVSLIVKRFRELGEEGFMEQRGARGPVRDLTEGEVEQLDVIFKKWKTPKGAGVRDLGEECLESCFGEEAGGAGVRFCAAQCDGGWLVEEVGSVGRPAGAAVFAGLL